MNELFFDAGRFATAFTQVVQLGTAYITTALDFDAGDQWAVGLVDCGGDAHPDQLVDLRLVDVVGRLARGRAVEHGGALCHPRV